MTNWSMAHFWKLTGWQDRTLDSLYDPVYRGPLWDAPRPIRNPMPAMTLFPRVERLEAAARVARMRLHAALDALTGRMDLEPGYGPKGWD